jgi:hypothetical protein
LAENETLTVDGRTASRWRPLREQIASGESPSGCFAEIERQFYLSLRSACRQMAKQGVTLECLLTTALDNPDELEPLIRQTRNQEHACLLLQVVRCQRFLSLEQLVFAWVLAVWDSIHDLLQLNLNGHALDASFEDKVRGMLNRLARLIARNPTRIPKLPPRPKNPPNNLDGTLGQSIL